MHQAAESLLAVYPTDESATAALDRLAALVRAGTLPIVDLGVLRRDATGKVSCEPSSVEPGERFVSQPRTVIGLVGLIFPPVALVSPIDGASIGMVATHLKSTGVDGASLRRLGAVLDPGESAILVVVDRPWVEWAERALTGYAHIVRTRLSRPNPPETVTAAPGEESRG